MNYAVIKKQTEGRSLSMGSVESEKTIDGSRGTFIFDSTLLYRGITICSMVILVTVCGMIVAGVPKDSCYETGIGAEAVMVVILLGIVLTSNKERSDQSM